MELAVNASEVEGNRVYGHAELGGGGLVVVPLHQERQQPDLVRRQMVIRHVGRANLAEDGNYAAGDFGRHRRAAFDDVANAVEKCAGGVFFRRYPQAPAHNASKMRPSSSYTVSTSGRRQGSRSRSSRTPSIPDMPGRPISTSATSVTGNGPSADDRARPPWFERPRRRKPVAPTSRSASHSTDLALVLDDDRPDEVSRPLSTQTAPASPRLIAGMKGPPPVSQCSPRRSY